MTTTTTSPTILIPEDDARAVVAALVARKGQLERKVFALTEEQVAAHGKANDLHRGNLSDLQRRHRNTIAAIDRVLGQMGARL